MKPKWMEKQDSYRTKSDKRVKQIAKKTGHHVVPNSGATPFKKGDLQSPSELIEHKMTSKESFKLHKEVLSKTYTDAVKCGKIPILIIDFGDYTVRGEIQKS